MFSRSYRIGGGLATCLAFILARELMAEVHIYLLQTTELN